MSANLTRKIGIVGYTGMVGMELTSHIEKMDGVEIVYTKNSKGETGKMSDCDLIFLATKDKESMVNARLALEAGCKVIDMSGAFRLSEEEFEKWYHMDHEAKDILPDAVYGLPAINREKIKNAKLIANPGCYATSVILALRPVADLVEGEATVVSTSGNSGARKEAEDVADDIAYSYGKKHKHVPEMARYSGVPVNFTPVVLRSVFRGINTNIRVKLKDSATTREQLEEAVKKAYVAEDLITVVRDENGEMHGTKDVNDTNAAIIKINVDEGYAYINCCIDNLGKGAATQGIENMMLMLGM
ncbi:MAG: hypothetical protein E7388_07640 [Ruminococcaceae bacterium]|nr:hypothetical protein [Oscillospiraceae bacterium]